MRNLEGKVAFVTGGASGIGLGMAHAFLAEGMKVVIADYSETHLEAARALLVGSNAVHFLMVDVSDREAMRRAAEEALSVFGKIHVLCNNAGVGGGGLVDDPDFEEWDRAMGVNLGGVVNGVKVIVPIIKAQGEGGHVVNTASMAGMVPLPGLGAYSTAKYAVRGLSESLRMSLAPEGIGVSCLFPGATRSALVPVPDDDSGAPVGEAGAYLRELWGAMRVAMDPRDMGAAVVRAIRDNRFHILTHAEFLDEVRARHRAIEAAFPADDRVPHARRAFEDRRRATVDGLFDRPARD
ncbi:MAG TPA: SDR family NAD(P)-dependent oxidoreductase [Sphingomonadaceae bacterium]|nr:SDR family NAD(P)-dependent oxidoreductase [Sphingomonadaceae bacterium]